VELLESTDPEGVIARFIEKKGEGLHHLAFEVEDIYREVARMTEAGFTVLGQPKKGADNKLVVFLHPKSTGGTLIELVQSVS
jgi:methylmalonyl-CoA/ethylmalonyl-CoA epimerase